MTNITSHPRIFTAYSDRIKTETIDELDNFIMQVISPTCEELLAVHEHNR
jgi:hypothetical protein